MSTTANMRALPAVGVRMLESLYQHRLLTSRQVHVLHTPASSLRWTRQILAQLHQYGLAERAIGPHGSSCWFLTSRGAEAIRAAGTLAEPRQRLTTPEQATGPLRRHTLAVNDTGIAFAAAARQRDGDECGPLSWRHEIAHPIAPAARGQRLSHLVIADALLTYLQTTPDQTLTVHQRFIELDRGTIPPPQLAGKLARYAQLHQYTPKPPAQSTGQRPQGPLWHAYYRTFPPVLVVLADQTPAAARRRIQRVIALHQTDPSRTRYGTVPISFVTLTDLAAHGPFAAIFINAEQPDHYQDWLGNTRQKPQKEDDDACA